MNRAIIIVLILILGVIAGASYYLQQALYVPLNSDTKDKTFEVKEKTSTSEIASNLQKQGFIKSKNAFQFYVKIRRWPLQPGRYSLKSSYSAVTIAYRLYKAEVQEVTVTFPEGWRLTQMAERLEQKKLVKGADFLKAAEGQEGYLFPDTYVFPVKVDIPLVIKTMRDNYTSRTKGLNVTPDILILASIVEREAKTDEERPMIAGVYTNRIKKNMKLQADPTVQYAKGSWEPITMKDYQDVKSPYNTYLNNGLPPGPICNPGLKSIQAALNPTAHDYLYFLHDSQGKAHFAVTQEEHNSNIAQYLH